MRSITPPSFFGPVSCDSDGNVVYTPGDLKSDYPNEVVKVSPDGKVAARVTLTSVAGIRPSEASIYRMTVGVDGSVHVLAGDREGPQIVSFGSDGKYRSRTRFSPQSVSGLAVFKSGEFLLAGTAEGQADLRILSPTGSTVPVRLVRDPSDRARPWSESIREIAGSTMVEAGQDGLVYLARPGPKGPVFAISAEGLVVNEFELEPPVRGASLVSMKLSDGRLAAEYQQPSSTGEKPKRWIAIYSLADGERISVYPRPAGMLLCYRSSSDSRDRFTFLGASEKGELQLVPATASD